VLVVSAGFQRVVNRFRGSLSRGRRYIELGCEEEGLIPALAPKFYLFLSMFKRFYN